MTTPATPVLDWHPPSDTRKEANQPYRLTTQLGAIRERAKVDPNLKDLNEEVPLRSRAWVRRRWLDQGQQGACTGFGAGHCLSCGMKPWPITDEDAFQFYYWARKFDAWHGEDYEGSSVQGVAEGLKHMGFLDAYWWCETMDEVLHAIAQFGAVEVGTWWKTGMWTPDASGVIRATGGNDGGHAYTIAGADLRRGLAKVDNSWGRRWGTNGSAWLPLEDLENLLFRQGGECSLFRKKRYIYGLLPSEGGSTTVVL